MNARPRRAAREKGTGAPLLHITVLHASRSGVSSFASRLPSSTLAAGASRRHESFEHQCGAGLPIQPVKNRRSAPGGEPPKLIVMASSARIAQIASAQPVPMRLGGELLAATCLALTPFETTA